MHAGTTLGGQKLYIQGPWVRVREISLAVSLTLMEGDFARARVRTIQVRERGSEKLGH